MLLVALLSVLATSVHSQDEVLNNASDIVPADFDGRWIGYSTVLKDEFCENAKFLAYISNVAYDTQYGTGVIVNKMWAITPTIVVEGKQPEDLMVSVCVYTYVPTQTEQKRRVKKMVPSNCGTNKLVDCMTLLKFCPALGDEYAAKLAPSLFPYDSTRPIKLYNFYTASVYKLLQVVSKRIGPPSGCSSNPDFVSGSHLCLTYNANEHSTVSDLKGMIMFDAVTSEVVGFLVKEQTATNGEIILHLKTMQNFIDEIHVDEKNPMVLFSVNLHHGN